MLRGMRPLSTSELLDIWEWGRTESPLQRALILLSAGFPQAQPEELARLSIGGRDRILLQLRALTFGTHMAGLACCSNCGDRLELSFDIEDILVEPEAKQMEVMSLSLMGYDVIFRLPDSLDLIQSREDDVPAMRQKLIELCIQGVDQEGREIKADQLPEEVVEAAIDQMARADPQSDVRLALVCPSCGFESQSTFDIVSFFWSEISARASRLTEEVHLLAQEYGWSEGEILALSPWRRQVYLDLVDG